MVKKMSRLRDERRRRGWSQFELSKRSNIHPIEIGRIERGIVKPFPGWRKRLSEALGVPENELFGEEGKGDAITR
ncbi:helix-turn-helix domain-containing protein [Moorella naiadis (nom. illeg.)]|uniref:helix-turn-helix domain-containing protein n=1 Tax=Moorella naiadis (nom. illeg.) TaxID=3093670 RepID=UPI003D9C8E3D